MDKFDFIDEKRSKRSNLSVIWNCLTVVVLLMTACVVVGVLTIYINPNSGYNLFPPPPTPVAIDYPTFTPTPLMILPPTWTPIPSTTPPPTSTPLPSPTVTATSTLTPTATLTPTIPAPVVVLYALSSGSPTAIASTTFHPESGCTWLGVAGVVLDSSGVPVPPSTVLIRVGGLLGDKLIEQTGMAGTATAYGNAGYEIVLSNQPFATTNTLWIQLFDPQDKPLTERIFFSTFGTCSENLLLINFRAIRQP